MAENAGEQQPLDKQRSRPSAGPALQADSNPARPQISNTISKNSNASTAKRAHTGHPRSSRPTLIPQPHRSLSRAPHPSERPLYSLAGNPTIQPQGQSYVDPKYYEFNPRYQKPENAPVWGLAKPFPRVVRPGMRRGQDGGAREQNQTQGVVEDTDAEVEEPGGADTIPQLGMIGEQRRMAGKDSGGRKKINPKEHGYGHQELGEGRNDMASRVRSGNSDGHHMTPKDEKGDPMDDWLAKQPSRNSDHFDEQSGDLPMHRLPSVQEVPSRVPSATTTVSQDFAEGAIPQDAVDLEAGHQSDEWSLGKEEANQYVQEEWEMHNGWASFRARFREPLAECLATMVMVTIGLCTNLAVQTSNKKAGTFQSQNWGWGLGVTLGIYIAGGISGGHLNPVISLMLCLYRGFPFRKALVYIAAQLFGAFLAGLIAYGIYRDAIISYDSQGGDIAAKGGSSAPVGISAGGTGTSLFTEPESFEGIGAAFGNEFVATAFLSCAILALGDDSNAPPGAGMHALIVGLVVFVLTMAFGYNTGGCMNPARDFGPRVVAAIVGYGGRVFTDYHAWWIYGAWGATISGGLVGGLLYDACVFVGGESPINYPRGRRRRAGERAMKRWWHLKTEVKRGVRSGVGKEDAGKTG
ncbi:putative membrane protein [Lachnellula subtilissima]|uniref:Putative membrane protein n=1 Tax=Lachnellula subtilissima TaxID=602034 RepID=A0A8H8RGF8_9HELO|nr:putative membrane protein [Lachnellula subtilissima]